MSEVQNLTSAFNTLKNNGDYDDFVERHFNAASVAHRGALFLPWHRKFLEELESALRNVDSSIEALPYWPWEQNSGLGSLWTESSFGPDGDPNNGFRVLSGPFADWRALISNVSTGQLEVRSTPGLVRDLGSPGSLPSAGSVQNILNGAPNYAQVRPALENAPLHNAIHIWVGGDMTVMTSPNDPIFFLHHCNCDRLWWQWQLANGIDNYDGPTGTMPFLQGSPTPAEVFDIEARGYTYA
jgi:tyrosinase